MLGNNTFFILSFPCTSLHYEILIILSFHFVITYLIESTLSMEQHIEIDEQEAGHGENEGELDSAKEMEESSESARESDGDKSQ